MDNRTVKDESKRVSHPVVFLLLAISIATNVYQFRNAHMVGSPSHTEINGIPAPDKIVWNGRTYWTDGGANQNLLQLKWLGTVTAGSKEMNIFQEVGQNPRKQIDYILGNRLVTADYHPESGQ